MKDMNHNYGLDILQVQTWVAFAATKHAYCKIMACMLRMLKMLDDSCVVKVWYDHHDFCFIHPVYQVAPNNFRDTVERLVHNVKTNAYAICDTHIDMSLRNKYSSNGVCLSTLKSNKVMVQLWKAQWITGERQILHCSMYMRWGRNNRHVG